MSETATAIEAVPEQEKGLAAAGDVDYSAVEALIARGDLSQLKPEERSKYVMTLCKTLNLNPLTKPFDFLTLNGKMVLYINRNATDQLRKVHRINLTIVERGVLEVGGVPTDVYTVKAHAALPDGRTDESVAAVSIKGKAGEDLANAIMRCETKSKRRVTLSILGLSFTDESELDTINYVKPQSSEPRVIAPRALPSSGMGVDYSAVAGKESAGVGQEQQGSPSTIPASAQPEPPAPTRVGAPAAGLAPLPPSIPAGRGTPQAPSLLPPPRPATPAPQVSSTWKAPGVVQARPRPGGK